MDYFQGGISNQDDYSVGMEKAIHATQSKLLFDFSLMIIYFSYEPRGLSDFVSY